MVIFLHAVLHWRLACLYCLVFWYRAYQQCCYASLQVQRREFLGNTVVAQEPTQICGYARLRGLVMFLHIIFMLFISSGRILLNKCSVRQHMPRICLTDSVKVPRGLRAYIMIGNVTNRDSRSFHEKRESLVFFIDFFCSDTHCKHTLHQQHEQ